MNRYNITYTVGEGVTETASVIDRSEAAARNYFKTHYKGNDIVDVELSETDVSATKQQERGALVAIRKIVEELGPDSYVGTAFAGCFDLAEWNIESDAADNFPERVEHLDKIRLDAQGKQAEAEAESKRLKADLEAAQRSSLSHPLRVELLAFMTEARDAARARMASSAEIMAEMADAPQDIAFTGAVKQYRKAKAQVKQCERLFSGLDAIETI
jgi:hypothetical protein